MALGCGANCAKILLIVFNFIFWLSGAGILAIGIWMLADKNFSHYFAILEMTSPSGPLLKYAAYVLIGIGAFVFLVGFLGCCGAIKESRCMLGLYIFFLVIVMGGELAAGIVTLLYRQKVKETLLTEWKKQLDDVYGLTSDKDKAFTNAMNIFQFELKCCGVKTGVDDYLETKWASDATLHLEGDTVLPFSCCVLNDGVTSGTEIKPENVKDNVGCQGKVKNAYYDKGCYEATLAWFEDHSLILIGVGIGIACLELFGFIFAVLLCRNVGKE